ncbi:MAG: hypothetical protein NTZ60_02975 [Campylobacterales bacterium]|nr:hypothetical protein [Campylobacterales bacterium]
MLQFFEESKVCKIILHAPLMSDDVLLLRDLFYKEYKEWVLEFGTIYNIDKNLVHLLYKEIFKANKKVSIITHKSKLNRYLNKLGFQTKFISLLKDKVVNTHDIKVILIGGSADSSPKIVNIISKIKSSNLSIVIVQHVQSERIGKFDEILQKYTAQKVCYAQDGEKIEKGVIYLAPNNKHLKVSDGCFVLSDEEKYNFAKPSVSLSYESFAFYYKEFLVVVQECGNASDGVDKLEFLKQNKSTVILQDKDECKAKSMVMNALALNVHDYVFHQEDIITYINFLNQQSIKEFYIEEFLEMLVNRYGYDFRLYHRDMIQRRIEFFMIKHEIKNIKDAMGLVLFNKTAFNVFFLDVSINVTEFFRKPTSFVKTIELLKHKYTKAHNIKVWSAGCSSGEEVYSMAIILKNLGLLEKSMIYATDFNSVVLEEAKNGIYSNESFEQGSHNYKHIGLSGKFDDYVLRNNNFVTIKDEIREKTLFFGHNLATDSSFKEFDIIICKNVIIYFDNDLQKKVFQLFYDSLKFGGYLILGQSETIHADFINNFKQCAYNCKIFKKVD